MEILVRTILGNQSGLDEQARLGDCDVPRFRLCKEEGRFLRLDDEAERKLLAVAEQQLKDIIVVMRVSAIAVEIFMREFTGEARPPRASRMSTAGRS